jgi:hypothetical protein
MFRPIRPSSGINVHNFKNSSFKFRPQMKPLGSKPLGSKPLGSKQRGGFGSVVFIGISLGWKKSL